MSKLIRNDKTIGGAASNARNIAFNKVNTKVVTKSSVQGVIEELDDAIDSLNSNLANSTKWKLVGNIVGIGNSVTVPTIAKECLIITHNTLSNVKTSFTLTENELKETADRLYENAYYRTATANGSTIVNVKNYTITLHAVYTNGSVSESSSARAVVYYR